MTTQMHMCCTVLNRTIQLSPASFHKFIFLQTFHTFNPVHPGDGSSEVYQSVTVHSLHLRSVSIITTIVSCLAASSSSVLRTVDPQSPLQLFFLHAELHGVHQVVNVI